MPKRAPCYTAGDGRMRPHHTQVQLLLARTWHNLLEPGVVGSAHMRIVLGSLTVGICCDGLCTWRSNPVGGSRALAGHLCLPPS
jgi:hypothetical protein